MGGGGADTGRAALQSPGPPGVGLRGRGDQGGVCSPSAGPGGGGGGHGAGSRSGKVAPAWEEVDPPLARAGDENSCFLFLRPGPAPRPGPQVPSPSLPVRPLHPHPRDRSGPALGSRRRRDRGDPPARPRNSGDDGDRHLPHPSAGRTPRRRTAACPPRRLSPGNPALCTRAPQAPLHPRTPGGKWGRS